MRSWLELQIPLTKHVQDRGRGGDRRDLGDDDEAKLNHGGKSRAQRWWAEREGEGMAAATDPPKAAGRHERGGRWGGRRRRWRVRVWVRVGVGLK